MSGQSDSEKLKAALDLVQEVQSNHRTDVRMANLIQARRGIKQTIQYLEQSEICEGNNG